MEIPASCSAFSTGSILRFFKRVSKGVMGGRVYVLLRSRNGAVFIRREPSVVPKAGGSAKTADGGRDVLLWASLSENTVGRFFFPLGMIAACKRSGPPAPLSVQVQSHELANSNMQFAVSIRPCPILTCMSYFRVCHLRGVKLSIFHCDACCIQFLLRGRCCFTCPNSQLLFRPPVPLKRRVSGLLILVWKYSPPCFHSLPLPHFSLRTMPLRVKL